MDVVSLVVEALPQELRTHKAILTFKEWDSVKLLRRVARAATRRNPRLINKYLTANAVRKLHLGCGYHRMAGWLNCDLDPMRDAIILDVTRPYPFAENTFDFIYCEHMIEHIPYSGGRAMLEESYRVLKPGGRLRIATPDVRFLFRLYRDDRSALEEEYIAWSGAQFLGDKAPHTALGVINNFVRDWGHTFIYDSDTLPQSMEAAGFVEITPMKIGESDKPALKGLENAARMPVGYYELETCVFEATKR
jgi:predicted SAM-dependent methyltransferase